VYKSATIFLNTLKPGQRSMVLIVCSNTLNIFKHRVRSTFY